MSASRSDLPAKIVLQELGSAPGSQENTINSSPGAAQGIWLVSCMEKPFRMSQREETGTGAYMGLCLGSEHSTREVVLTRALPEETLADLEESPPKHRVP